MFDKFLDLLNVSNFTNGTRYRKPFQHPYRSSDDHRLKVIYIICSVYTVITKYVSHTVVGGCVFALLRRMGEDCECSKWLQQNPKEPNASEHWDPLGSSNDRYVTHSSAYYIYTLFEIALIVHSTAYSFVGLVRYMFSLPVVKENHQVFLSQHLCQDSLEKFFGCQRQRGGGTSNNPSTLEFYQNTQSLRVVNSFAGDQWMETAEVLQRRYLAKRTYPSKSVIKVMFYTVMTFV